MTKKSEWEINYVTSELGKGVLEPELQTFDHVSAP